MKNLKISDKIRNIISNYYKIVLFEEDPFSFEPKVVISMAEPEPLEHFENTQSEMRKIGYQIKLHYLKDYELKNYDFEKKEDERYYEIKFKAKEFVEFEKKPIKKKKIVQIALFSITSLMIVLSGYFYVYFIDPYYGGFNKPLLSTFLAIFSYSLGMFLIIFIHELGHIFFSRRHKLNISAPYLIPGPPPFGTLGAFVSIKDDPQTRNQKFDVAIGGIIFGIITSLILIVIGLSLSVQMDTESYLRLRATYFGTTPAHEAKLVHDNMNLYNLLFLGLRFLFFEPPTYSYYYGCYLPNKIVIIHPLAFAGWIGLLLSGLNLITFPFLDGGHVLRAVFPKPYIRIIGTIVGFLIFLTLNPYLMALSVLPNLLICISQYSLLQSRKSEEEEIPNPTIPLTNSRKIFALCLILLFILLYPLSYDNIIYGFGI